jgi:hypothetical protein
MPTIAPDRHAPPDLLNLPQKEPNRFRIGVVPCEFDYRCCDNSAI